MKVNIYISFSEIVVIFIVFLSRNRKDLHRTIGTGLEMSSISDSRKKHNAQMGIAPKS